MKALNHSEARTLIERAADGLLTSDQQRALESHLQGCADCRAYAGEFAALEAALGDTFLERWGKPQLSQATENKLVKQLQETFGPNGGSGGGPGAKSFGNWARWAGPLILLVLLAAAAMATLEFRAAQPKQETVELMLDLFESETPTPTASRTATVTRTVTKTPTETPSPLVLVAIPKRNANCREGNGNSFDITDTLFEGVPYTPIARGFDNLWVQFRGPVTNVKCWAFIENIDLLIDEVVTPIEEIPESLLPFVGYPPSPTPTFTATPTSATQPQCSDGIDNDKDGAIDMQDKDCKDRLDNNEFD